ncbi:hypothetical protein PMAYCL1PPCAC_00775, partial [Pristionchus mayeri]
MGKNGKRSCKGDLCFIIRTNNSEGSEFERGCITNNEELYPNLFKIGYFEHSGKDHIICLSNRCNKDWEEAEKSVIIKEPACATTPSPTTTTTNPSEIIKDYFRRRWNSLVYGWTNEFNDVM